MSVDIETQAPEAVEATPELSVQDSTLADTLSDPLAESGDDSVQMEVGGKRG